MPPILYQVYAPDTNNNINVINAQNTGKNISIIDMRLVFDHQLPISCTAEHKTSVGDLYFCSSICIQSNVVHSYIDIVIWLP